MNKNRILIVVDMQNDFIDGSLGTKEAQGIVFGVTEKIKNFDGTIFVTRDTHFENYMESQEGKNLPVPHCVKGTEGWQLNKEVEKALLERPEGFYDKITFGSVDLAADLRERNEKEKIEEIVLIGLCTDICILSNAILLKAFMPEVKISVDAGCCAGVTPESHRNALEAMKMCQIQILE